MASDKIVNKILESANQDAQDTLKKAQEQADQEVLNIKKETEDRLKSLKNQFDSDCENVEKRSRLNAGLEERKHLLGAKRYVMDLAFDEAKKNLENLPEEEWAELIKKVVQASVVTDTEYIKVPEKDMPRYTKPFLGGAPFLEQLNEMLKEGGHNVPLKLDRNPAHFKDGVMLIGKYSDVNASFDVLLANMREYLEWDVVKMLFPEEANG